MHERRPDGCDVLAGRDGLQPPEHLAGLPRATGDREAVTQVGEEPWVSGYEPAGALEHLDRALRLAATAQVVAVAQHGLGVARGQLRCLGPVRDRALRFAAQLV